MLLPEHPFRRGRDVKGLYQVLVSMVVVVTAASLAVPLVPSSFPGAPLAQPPPVSPAQSDFTEFAVPANSTPTHVDTGFGFVWVSAIESGSVLRLDPDTGDVATYAIPVADAGPCGLVVGMGRVWFMTVVGKLGRLTPSTGAIDLYDVPGGFDIRHPDVGFGSVWFVAIFNASVGRYTPSTGTFTMYPLESDALPTEVAAGLGSVWYTDRGRNTIGRINPNTDAITEYAIPTANAGPYGITVAFGRVWFVERTAGQVASFNPASETFTEYDVPGAGNLGFGFITQGGSSIWYTRSTTNRIGQLDPNTGDVVEHDVPTSGAFLHSIRFGFGALWFAEAGVNQVGRLPLE